MKRIRNAGSILAVVLMIITGCGGGNPSTNGLITVDVTKSYPKKDLILQDFMDVEYIPLETTEGFLNQGLVMAVGRDVMIVRNRVDDGDIFVFDRTGKGLRKFNRKGKGAGEYIYIWAIVLDEEAGEMFVNDMQGERIQVYDLYGGHKRSIRYPEDISYNRLAGFDRESLICSGAELNVVGGIFTFDLKKPDAPEFVIISKQDGSIIRGIDIDYKEEKSTVVFNTFDNGVSIHTMNYLSIIPDRTGWILIEPSADTVYRIAPDYSMTPVIARTPSIQTMQPEVFLFPAVLTDRYVFMARARKEVFSGRPKQTPYTNLMYDREDNSIHEYTAINGDYTVSKPIDMLQIPVNAEIAFQQKIDAIDLVDAYGNGQLKGRLKEIAATLDEESNPVIMLVKHR